jgi:hypothetical protein
MINFSKIDKTSPLFSVLLSFRSIEGELLQQVSSYLPLNNGRYLYVPFLYRTNDSSFDCEIYTATYDRLNKEFINISDINGVIIDLKQPKARKRKGGNGAIGM